MSSSINLLGINLAGGIALAAASVLVIVLLVMYSVWGLGRVLLVPNNKRQANVKMGKVSIQSLLAFVIVLGLLARVLASLLVVGQSDYTVALQRQYSNYQNSGLQGYQTVGNLLYPLAYLINGLFGTVGNVFGDPEVLTFFLRLPLMLADVASAFVLYFIARKYVNKQVAAIVSALFFLNPLFIFNSGIAGQANSLLTLTLLVVFYFMANRKTVLMVLFYGISLLVHRDAQMLFVPIAVYLVYLFVRSILTIKRNGRDGFLKDNTRNSVVVVPVAIVGVFFAMWLISIFFVSGVMGYNPFVFLNRMYIQMLQTYDSYGTDALSLYNLFKRNGELTAFSFPALMFGIVFVLLSTLISVVLYLSKRNRANMVLISSFVMLTLGLYFVNFTHSTLVPCVALILLSYVFIKDRRLLKVYVLLSIAIVLNQIASVVNNGLLEDGFGFAVNVAMSVLAILTHMYFTVVVLDICMSSNIVALSADPNIAFGQANKNWLRIKKHV